MTSMPLIGPHQIFQVVWPIVYKACKTLASSQPSDKSWFDHLLHAQLMNFFLANLDRSKKDWTASNERNSMKRSKVLFEVLFVDLSIDSRRSMSSLEVIHTFSSLLLVSLRVAG